MAKAKKIVVACGSGVATSQTVACKLKDLLDANGMSGVTIDVTDFKQIDSIIKLYDVYVSISPGNEKDHGIPTFSGIPFLTGIGMQAELDKLIAELKK